MAKFHKSSQLATLPANKAWEKRGHPNLLFLTYEELKSDFSAAVGKLSSFLGLEGGWSEEKTEALRRETSLESFRANDAVNKRAEMSLDKQERILPRNYVCNVLLVIMGW